MLRVPLLDFHAERPDMPGRIQGRILLRSHRRPRKRPQKLSENLRYRHRLPRHRRHHQNRLRTHSARHRQTEHRPGTGRIHPLSRRNGEIPTFPIPGHHENGHPKGFKSYPHLNHHGRQPRNAHHRKRPLRHRRGSRPRWYGHHLQGHRHHPHAHRRPEGALQQTQG